MISITIHQNVTLLLFLLLIIPFFISLQNTDASAAAVKTNANNIDDEKCFGNREEDKILCDAAKVKKESIKSVIEEDETTHIENQTPPSDRAQDVWKSAYNRWISKDSSKKKKKKSIDHAIREAQKSNPSATLQDTQTKLIKQDPVVFEQDEDELTVITSAVRTLSDTMTTSEMQLKSLTIIEDLCYSGDNGRQVEATGGVDTLIKLISDKDKQISLQSVKALATCAQNNPKVFNKAVEKDAISRLIQRLQIEDTDEWRASVLRALVSLSDSTDADKQLYSEREHLMRIFAKSFDGDGSNGRRSKIRSLALIEQCLRMNQQKWLQLIEQVDIIERVKGGLKDDDIDIREGSARILKLIR